MVRNLLAAIIFLAAAAPPASAADAFLEPSSRDKSLSKLCIRESPVAAAHCTPPAMIWKLITADVDGDGQTEYAVALHGTKRGRPGRANGLHIYKWNGGALEPLWRGSSLSMPFRDTAFADIDADGVVELVSLEVNPVSHAAYLSSYTWDGFGFAGEMNARLPDGIKGMAVYPAGNSGAPAVVALLFEHRAASCTMPAPPRGSTSALLACSEQAAHTGKPAAILSMDASIPRKDSQIK